MSDHELELLKARVLMLNAAVGALAVVCDRKEAARAVFDQLSELTISQLLPKPVSDEAIAAVERLRAEIRALLSDPGKAPRQSD